MRSSYEGTSSWMGNAMFQSPACPWSLAGVPRHGSRSNGLGSCGTCQALSSTEVLAPCSRPLGSCRDRAPPSQPWHGSRCLIDPLCGCLRCFWLDLRRGPMLLAGSGRAVCYVPAPLSCPATGVSISAVRSPGTVFAPPRSLVAGPL